MRKKHWKQVLAYVLVTAMVWNSSAEMTVHAEEVTEESTEVLEAEEESVVEEDAKDEEADVEESAETEESDTEESEEAAEESSEAEESTVEESSETESAVEESSEVEEETTTEENLEIEEATTEEATTEEETTEEATTEEMTTEVEEEEFSVKNYLEFMPGMPETYTLSNDQQEEKKDLSKNTDDIYSYIAGENFVEDEVIVLAEDEDEAEVIANAYGGEMTHFNEDFAVIKLEDEITVYNAVAVGASRDNNMPAVWPNYYRYATDIDDEELEVVEEATSETEVLAYNDPQLKFSSAYYQWQHNIIASQTAWYAGYTGSGVKVAVIDTGANTGHTDLGANIKGTYNVLDKSTNVTDTVGHGTHVAGIIAAKANNGIGGAGIAPNASLYIIKASSAGSFTDSAIMDAIKKAVAWDVDLVNMSLGGPGYSGAYTTVTNSAEKNGVILFAAAGNEGGNCKEYPGADSGIICIGATDTNNQRAYFSTYGSWVDFAAPGVDIYSTDKNGGYSAKSGTSMACPVAVGTAAVIMSANETVKNATGAKRRVALIAAMKKGASSAGAGTGAGVVSLSKALGLSDSMVKPNPPVFAAPSATYISDLLTVTITAPNDSSCKIYYTIDGKNPVVKNGVPAANTKLYTAKFAVMGQSKNVVKAIAVNASGVCSKVVTATYILKPEVKSIVITAPTTKIAQGGSTTLTAAVEPDYAKTTKVTWKVTPEKQGVTVSAAGKVTATAKAAVRTYTVYAVATDGTNIQSNKLSLQVAKVDSIKKVAFTTKKAEVKKASTAKTYNVAQFLDATKESGAKASASDFSWSSSNTKMATVNASGNVTVLASSAPGNVTITALSKDGKNKKATFTIKVLQAVTGVSMPSSVTIGAGKSMSVAATVSPANASNKKITYTIAPVGSANQSAGKVSGAGKVSLNAKAATAGTKYTVTAVAADGSGAKATCTVTVSSPVSTLTLNQKAYKLYRVSGADSGISLPTSFKLTATAKNAAGAGSSAYTYTSSNTGIATVASDGTVKVTGKATGTVTITCAATDGSGKKATCKVSVLNPASGLSLSPTGARSYMIAKGKSLQLSAVLYSNYGTVSNKSVTWSSNRSDVTVSNGKVTAKANASVGSAVITAKANDGKLVATYDVYITGVTKAYGIGRVSTATTYYLYEGDVGQVEICPNPRYIGRYLIGSDSFYSNGKYQFSPEISVTTSNPDILYANYVASSGKLYIQVYGLKKGSASVTITANDGSNAKTTYKFDVRKSK